MCKPKNRIMCPDCGRSKILFDSEAKANNFIKYNAENLENGDKLRAYYCPACCGWHVTHQEYHPNMDGKTEQLINEYNKLKTKYNYEEVKDLIDEFYNILVDMNLKSRDAVNKATSKPEFDKYNQFVKQEAKTRYYQENKILKPLKTKKKKK